MEVAEGRMASRALHRVVVRVTAVRPDDTAGTARPLYWCPHWTTLNEMPCDTCLGEGPQAAYYRADDYERLRNLVSGGNCIRDDKDGLSPCERAVARAERAEALATRWNEELHAQYLAMVDERDLAVARAERAEQRARSHEEDGNYVADELADAMQALWDCYVAAGGDTEGDDGWRCETERACRIVVAAVRRFAAEATR